MIDITGTDLVKFAQHVYELSSPVGMGFMKYTKGPLSDKDAKDLLLSVEDCNIALSMDYVKGRACKMTVFRKNGKLLVRDDWFDHSKIDYEKLISQARQEE
jgi:hypothetical protein